MLHVLPGEWFGFLPTVQRPAGGLKALNWDQSLSVCMCDGVMSCSCGPASCSVWVGIRSSRSEYFFQHCNLLYSLFSDSLVCVCKHWDTRLSKASIYTLMNWLTFNLRCFNPNRLSPAVNQHLYIGCMFYILFPVCWFGPLTPCDGLMVQPSSAVAVVESISTSAQDKNKS